MIDLFERSCKKIDKIIVILNGLRVIDSSTSIPNVYGRIRVAFLDFSP